MNIEFDKMGKTSLLLFHEIKKVFLFNLPFFYRAHIINHHQDEIRIMRSEYF